MTDPLDQPASKPEPTQSTELIVPGALVPAVIFAKGGADDILKQLRDMVATVKTDISSAKGRAAIKSLAYKIARSKTALDDMGKDLSDKLRAQIDPILEERRKIREGCDALKEQVTAPLDAWEAQEAERIKTHEDALTAIARTAEFFSDEPTSAHIAEQIELLDAMTLAPYNWQEFIQRAIDTKAAARKTLVDLLDHTVAREQREAEAARLAAEQEAARIAELARQQAEREAEIARQAAETARLAAEEEAARQAETARIAAEAETARVAEVERLERERIQREADEAAERARLERDRIEREAQQAKDAAERERVRLVEEAAERERQRIADQHAAEARAEAAARRAEQEKAAAVQAERDQQAAELRRQEADRQRREADKKHRAAVNTRAVGGLISYGGLTEEQAKAVVTAIAKGQVPGVKIEY